MNEPAQAQPPLPRPAPLPPPARLSKPEPPSPWWKTILSSVASALAGAVVIGLVGYVWTLGRDVAVLAAKVEAASSISTLQHQQLIERLDRIEKKQDAQQEHLRELAASFNAHRHENGGIKIDAQLAENMRRQFPGAGPIPWTFPSSSAAAPLPVAPINLELAHARRAALDRVRGEIEGELPPFSERPASDLLCAGVADLAAEARLRARKAAHDGDLALQQGRDSDAREAESLLSRLTEHARVLRSRSRESCAKYIQAK